LSEELEGNPQDAAKKYEEMVSVFDQQRESAAQAVFRLGEAYRRMGRIEEARAMYARILREFVDFPDLVRTSQSLLTENAPTQPRASTDFSNPVPNPAEQDLIKQEIALLEQQLNENESLIKAGLASHSSGISLKREILQLKQRLARARTDWPTPPETERRASTASNSFERTGRGRISSELEALQIEVADLKGKLNLVSNHTDPDRLSSQVINDPRFAELKSSYERKLLDESGDQDSARAVQAARDRLVKWIQQIYLPELENTLSLKMSRLKEIEEQSQLRKR
jgi:tetratricopeptide (TPR) repeat protein